MDGSEERVDDDCDSVSCCVCDSDGGAVEDVRGDACGPVDKPTDVLSCCCGKVWVGDDGTNEEVDENADDEVVTDVKSVVCCAEDEASAAVACVWSTVVETSTIIIGEVDCNACCEAVASSNKGVVVLVVGTSTATQESDEFAPGGDWYPTGHCEHGSYPVVLL